MNLVGVMTMRNEADVLEAWVRYHAQLLDSLIVADHRSIDGSLELARDLESEGLPLEVVTADDVSYVQSRFVTGMARRAAAAGADWIFPLDADEFLNTQGQPLADTLVKEESDQPLSVPWRTYVPTAADPHDEACVPLRITWRLAEEVVPYSKVAIPGPLLRRPGTTIGIGSHELVDSGVAVNAASGPGEWSIAHFPVRSLDQLARKVFVGWVSVLSDPGRGPRTCYHWKFWFERLIEADFETLDLTEVAKNYLVETGEVETTGGLVRDPLPPDLCSFDLVAPRRNGVSPLKALASAAEALAAELGRLRSSLPLEAGEPVGRGSVGLE